jgi:hypothetical protein
LKGQHVHATTAYYSPKETVDAFSKVTTGKEEVVVRVALKQYRAS